MNRRKGYVCGEDCVYGEAGEIGAMLRYRDRLRTSGHNAWGILHGKVVGADVVRLTISAKVVHSVAIEDVVDERDEVLVCIQGTLVLMPRIRRVPLLVEMI